MARYIASRLYGEFLPDAAGTAVVFGVTGFNVSGGERNMIDITTGADDRRYSYGGLASPLTASMNFVYQGEITALDAALANCKAGQLWIKTATNESDCGFADIIGAGDGVGLYVQCTGYTIEGELDGAVTGTVNFERIPAPVVPA